MPNSKVKYWPILVLSLLLVAGCSGVKQAVQQQYKGAPWAIEVGPGSEHVYWLRSHFDDADDQQVYRTAVGSGETEQVVGGRNVLDIAVDEKRGHLYWSTQEGSVIRGRLDGTGREVVYDQVPYPVRIAFDSGEGMLYWMTTAEPSSYYKSEYFSGDPDPAKNRGMIQRIQVDTSSALGEGSTSRKPETLGTVSESTSITANILLGNRALEVDTSTGSVFFSGRKRTVTGAKFPTYRLEKEGTRSQVCELASQSVSDFGDTFRRPGLAVSSDQGVLYHTNDTEDSIVRVPYRTDGEIETLVSEGVLQPTDVAIDLGENRLYWVQRSVSDENVAGGVYRANLDGSGKELVYPDSLISPDRANQPPYKLAGGGLKN